MGITLSETFRQDAKSPMWVCLNLPCHVVMDTFSLVSRLLGIFKEVLA